MITIPLWYDMIYQIKFLYAQIEITVEDGHKTGYSGNPL